jgi:mono/diheme cytochrome c family protein
MWLRLGHAAALVLMISSQGAYSAEPTAQQKGELLFNIGGCTNCHTAKNGQPLAGGDPLVTPFGTFHPPNITPDPETGIGGWSDEAFIGAMQHGRSQDGLPYYPAFPYTSYTHMPAEDLRDLKSYLDTIPAVSKRTPEHELSFPYGIRLGLYPWQWLFFEDDRFEPDPSKDEAWNRGAYLVLGPGHCAQCHTPRTWYGALDEERLFAGGSLGPAEKDKVPNISSSEDGIGDWTTGDIVTFLELGIKPDGDFVGGDMAKVIENGTAKLPDEDRQAIATYLQSLPPL